MYSVANVFYQVNDLTACTKHSFTISTLSSLFPVLLYMHSHISIDFHCLYIILILCLSVCVCVGCFIQCCINPSSYFLHVGPVSVLAPVALDFCSSCFSNCSSALIKLHLSYVTTSFLSVCFLTLSANRKSFL